ncbi:unnamed protein product [Camellia sinensis]
MLRSKSRSGHIDFGKKNHTSVLSRTFSATKFCRGDPLISQIDSNALKPVEQKPSKLANLSEKQSARISTMQQHAGKLEGELKITTQHLGAVQEERDRALDELREMKMVAQEANMKLSEALSSRKEAEAHAELNTIKESLADSTREMKMKDKSIESLKFQLEKAKEFEVRSAERDVSFDRLQEELSNMKASEAQTMRWLSESKRRIQELEDEIERGKLSETKMYDTVASQTKQLEQTKIELEESKFEMTSLRVKIEKLEVLPCNHENVDSMKETIESLQSELQLAKENLNRAQEGEKVASLKSNNLLEEMNSLKSELKLAIEAEEKSKKAMDDLALVLKEVATEANQVKEKLSSTKAELEHIKQGAEQSKGTERITEDRYQKLLDEAYKETERYKNTVDRLRLEAEESLLAWNDKEIGFVSCIKSAEEEKTLAQQENIKLIESLKAANDTSKMAREENFKLRDILKQALNEASVAKEAASIARDENSQLKDSLAEKDETFDFLTRENERLRVNEAKAQKRIKELKQLLSLASTKESKTEDKEQREIFKSRNSIPGLPEDGKKLNKAFSFDLSELKIPIEYVNENVADEDPKKSEALKGSIFDTTESPKSEPHTPVHRRVPSSFMDDAETINSEDLEHLEGSHFGDENDHRNAQRKSRALLRRFGDLLKRSVHKKEPSVDHQTVQKKEPSIDHQ